LAAAKANFKLNRVVGNATVREHLELVEKKTGQRPKEFDECEVPVEAAHIWGWFHELHAARSNNGYGPNPISYTEIAAWGKLTGIRLREHEVRAIRNIDLVYLGVEAEGERKKWKR
jgi:hypothetical protein